jgi:hypothetical protein
LAEGAVEVAAIDDSSGYYEEILQNASGGWLVVVPDAKTMTLAICFGLEDAIAAGVKVVGFLPGWWWRSVGVAVMSGCSSCITLNQADDDA